MKVTRIVPGLVLFLALTTLAVPAAAQTFPLKSSLPGTFCLDIQDGILESGRGVQLYTCNGSAAQIWKLAGGNSSGGMMISPLAKPNLCLDVRGGVAANGTPVQVYTCNQTSSQGWELNAVPNTPYANTLTVMLGGRSWCLDAKGGIGADRTPVQIYECNGTPAQVWLKQ